MSTVTEGEESEEVDERVKAARKTRDLLGPLLKSGGWSMVKSAAERQVKARIDAIVLVPVQMEGISAQEFMKGEVAGLRLLLQLVESEYDEAVAILGVQDGG